MIEVLKQMVEALEWCHGGEPVGTAEAIQAGRQAIKELESQEPVGWIDSKGNMLCVKINESCRPLYTHPPQRKPLTDEQIETIRQQPQHHKGEFDYEFDYEFDELSFARAIEAAHGIKE
jgi:hypothetical protein